MNTSLLPSPLFLDARVEDSEIGRRNRPTSSNGVSAPSRTAYDSELVRRFTAGDESAFEEIVSRYRARVLAVAEDIVHNLGDAEEVAQDTFIRAYRNLAHFRGESSLSTWLHRIATNLARNRYWYHFRRKRHATLSLDAPLSAAPDTPLGDSIAAEVPDPARSSSRDEFARLVAGCMAQLEPHHRIALELRNVHSLPYEQIAAQLGINVGTVKSRIARARSNLLTLLAAACPEFGESPTPADWFEPAFRAIARPA